MRRPSRRGALHAAAERGAFKRAPRLGMTPAPADPYLGLRRQIARIQLGELLRSNDAWLAFVRDLHGQSKAD